MLAISAHCTCASSLSQVGCSLIGAAGTDEVAELSVAAAQRSNDIRWMYSLVGATLRFLLSRSELVLRLAFFLHLRVLWRRV